MSIKNKDKNKIKDYSNFHLDTLKLLVLKEDVQKKIIDLRKDAGIDEGGFNDKDDEDFVKERTVLKDRITRLKTQLRETESRAEKWLELTEKTFHFATYARKAFLVGSLSGKREILTVLGQNFSVSGKKLNIIKNDWLIPIEKRYPVLEAQLKKLELDKTLTLEARSAALASIRAEWGGYPDSNRRNILHRDVCYRYTIATKRLLLCKIKFLIPNSPNF